MEPHYNLWTIFFLLCSVSGIIASFCIYFHFSQKKAAVYISLLVFLFSITIADWVAFWTNNQSRIPFVFLITLFPNFLYGVLFFFYLKVLIGEKMTRFQQYIHFIPFISSVIICLPVLVANNELKKEIILEGYQYHFQIYRYIISFITWVSIVQMLLYGIAALRMLSRFKIYEAVYKWAVIAVVAYSIFALNFLIYEVLSRLSFFNPLWDYGIAISMILMIFVIVIAAYIQPMVFNGYTVVQSLSARHEEVNPNDFLDKEEQVNLTFNNHLAEQADEFDYTMSASKSQGDQNLLLEPMYSLTASEMGRLTKALDQLMLEEKIYLQYDLRLDNIASRLYVSRKKVSQIINQNFEMNFFDYINTLRIEEAKRMLKVEPDMSIKEIMFSVGFNNKVSFYKAFKNKTGLTPTDFRMKSTV